MVHFLCLCASVFPQAIYRLRVPADFGNKEVTWTNLQAAQEINERVVSSNGNLDPGDGDPNEPPSITIGRNLTASTATPPFRCPSRSTRGHSKRSQFELGSICGTAKAVFEQTGIPVVNSLAATVVRFPEAGIYKLRAIANDGALSTTADVVVTVK